MGIGEQEMLIIKMSLVSCVSFVTVGKAMDVITRNGAKLVGVILHEQQIKYRTEVEKHNK